MPEKTFSKLVLNQFSRKNRFLAAFKTPFFVRNWPKSDLEKFSGSCAPLSDEPQKKNKTNIYLKHITSKVSK